MSNNSPVEATELVIASPSSSITTSSTASEAPTIDLTADTQSPLKRIWDDSHIVKTLVDGKECWECKWCSKVFKPRHATRVLWHLMKIPGNGIVVCNAIIPELNLKRYVDLYTSNVGRASARVDRLLTREDFVVERQQAAVAELTAKRLPVVNCAGPLPGAINVDDSHSPLVANRLGFAPARKKQRIRIGFAPETRLQPSIEAAVNRGKQTDINRSNHTQLEMAIADLWHCENFPDKAVAGERFKLVIRYAMLVGPTFQIPTRNRIGKELLDLNFRSCQNLNRKWLMADASTFGLAFLGDGATIHRMPLINCLAICGSHSPTVLSIHDCTSHLETGGKKDAPYIAGIFDDHIQELDVSNTCTDIFMFDGASNVQKAGRLLEAKYPRAMTFHGGEHVSALFFFDISQLRAIKVRKIMTMTHFHFKICN